MQDPAPFTTEQFAAVAAKLQAFFETLNTDEQLILQAFLLDACGNPDAALRVLFAARTCPPAGVPMPAER